jgi:photosystem II stability/assembly factor-like uncharacterized protein
MSQTQTELQELGAALWPDDAVLHPQATPSGPARRRSAALSLAVAAGTAALVVVVVVGGVLLARSRTTVVAPATSPVPVRGAITQISMLSPTAGWGWGAPNVVGRSTDGAKTFVDVTPPGINPLQQVTALAATDLTHAWVLVTSRNRTLPNLVYRTDDGGQTWVAHDINAGNVVFEGLTFVDPQHGWAEAVVADSHIEPFDGFELLRTVDGGNSWSIIDEPPFPSPGAAESPSAGCPGYSLPTFVTPLFGVEGLSCGDATPYMLMTTNGGLAWRTVTLPQPSHPAGTIAVTTETDVPVFTTPDVGSVFASVCAGPSVDVCTSYGEFFHTVDGGATWIRTTTVRGDTPLVSPGEAWVVAGCVGYCPSWEGTPVELLHTTDGGKSWLANPLADSLVLGGFHGEHTFQFVNAHIGFDVTSLDSHTTDPQVQPRFWFYRTDDGGKTWTEFHPLLVRSAKAAT